MTKNIPLMVDAHQDLAWNMLTFRRDYRRSAAETRRLEAGTIVPDVNGDTMLGLAEFREVNLALVFATLFTAPLGSKEGDWDIITYRDNREANLQVGEQLTAYERLTGEASQLFTAITGRESLRTHINCWQEHLESGATDVPPVGLVYLMEGADGIREPEEVEEWFERGVRLFGPAWQATKYCGGTKEPGPLTRAGVELVRRIEGIRGILDISHMDELAVRQVFDIYGGAILATHANPFTPNRERDSNRFLKDDVILKVAERGGVIGLVPYNMFLDPGWSKTGRKEDVGLARFVEQIDYVCQLTGSAAYAGIGTDFDGGFGLQSVPEELDSVADMPKIFPLLREKGYTDSEIAGIFGQNWIRFLMEQLPD